VQLRSRARSTFSNFEVVSTFDVVGRRSSGRITGENPSPGHLVYVLLLQLIEGSM
jgi:hypothetical protein